MNHKISTYLAAAALATTMFSACTSDFMKEYSQDLSRVQSTDDLNELIVGDCFMPKGLFSYGGSSYSYENPNYAVLHFMGDEIQENLYMEGKNDLLGVRTTYFPYFTWQQNTYTDYKGKTTLKSNELNYWSLAYEKINNCNMVIEAADELSVTSEEDQMKLRRIKGEARFLRAFYYLTLANLYGKPYAPSTASTTLTVPLKTSGKVESADFTRATAADMYAQIVADLEQA
jgi:starch-binding outer membrane protein, SusD/RagB family